MKRLLIATIAGLYIIAGCHKQVQLMNNAELLGFDPRECACCGGLKIHIDGTANPSSGYFLANGLPDGFTLGDNPSFPIKVSINWQVNKTGCYGNYVIISQIVRR